MIIMILIKGGILISGLSLWEGSIVNVYDCVSGRESERWVLVVFAFSVIHRNCFISFVVCSMAHMVTFLLLYKAGRQPQSYRVGMCMCMRPHPQTTPFILSFVIIVESQAQLL